MAFSMSARPGPSRAITDSPRPTSPPPCGAGAAASARPAAQRVRPGETAQQRVAEVDVLAGVDLGLAGRVAVEGARAEALRVGLEPRVREVHPSDAAGLQVVEVFCQRVRPQPQR